MSYKRYNFYCGGELYNQLNIPKYENFVKTNAHVIGYIGQDNKTNSFGNIQHGFNVFYNITLPMGDVRRNTSSPYTVNSISITENDSTFTPTYTISGRTLKIKGNCWNSSRTSITIPTDTTVTLSIDYMGYEIFVPQSDTESLEALDQLANNYINNMNTLTVAFDSNNSDNLVATFTPLTDETLLDAVDDGKVTIRLQLMEHYPGGRARWTSGIRMKVSTSYGNAENKLNNTKVWGRSWSHDPDFYGRTWLNLTKSQLQSGSATLTNVKNTRSSHAVFDIWPTDIDNNIVYGALKVELFCAALKRKAKDPFFYERGGYRKISSNWVEYYIKDGPFSN